MFIDAIGLVETQKYFEQAPEIARSAARLAINQTAERKGVKAARDAMMAQVAFPPGYLDAPRFGLTQRATDSNLVAVIRGQFTPTPLGRFAGAARAAFVRGRGRRGGGVTVQIKPGHSVTLPRAFLLTLRNGNIGLAIRLKPGEILANTIGAKLITSGPLAGLALLYGPSVDQVFRTVAADITPAVLDDLQTEFLRQFVRLSAP
jgi:hypothetical protein